MQQLVNTRLMRQLEEAAIGSGRVSGLELMERAGHGVVAGALAHWPELLTGSRRALVLCGPGNNGGDGFVVARRLIARGWAVEVVLWGDPERLPPDARANHDRWAALGVVNGLGFPEPREAALRHLASVLRGGDQAPDLVVDALLGTGLTRAPAALGPLFDLWQRMRGEESGIRALAVDVPSGMCADSGRLFPPGPQQRTSEACLTADLTVTFHRAKTGHYLGRADARCGRVVVAGIGLDPVLDALGVAVAPEEETALTAPVLAPRRRDAHKYEHGHALVLTGGVGCTGAARLAARGALRIGAGLVSLGVPGAAQFEVAAQITALMLRRIDDAAALAAMLEDTRITALCLGPGLGTARVRDLVPAALRTRRPCVLDADALTAFADAPDTLFGMLHPGCVLTPHAGEFARLFPDLSARQDTAPPPASRLDAVRAAAARSGAVVLLKGPDTVIARPDGAARIGAALYDRAAPGLATAGAGDVLAGGITGLLAQGLAPLEASATAAHLHVDCARAFGPGLIAEDLPEILPQVLRAALPSA